MLADELVSVPQFGDGGWGLGELHVSLRSAKYDG
jgi:hypothetical protein